MCAIGTYNWTHVPSAVFVNTAELSCAQKHIALCNGLQTILYNGQLAKQYIYEILSSLISTPLYQHLFIAPNYNFSFGYFLTRFLHAMG